ncbi:hypothetical protein TRICI_003340 [Trichomonascus ciferrii]|uniref:Inosine/uridine-preferring nucleoside hydrolase domain-containing protein n=1 Tax=Trichomonascus ciferrii TaxID=44093 RepID=A0A642V493_9ASCO|nr:hypothetical protein TRICI_003340 [Trichomonascus ciferrii]
MTVKEQKTKLIIDSDPGVDDVLAILLAMCVPDVDLKLISLVFGNCDTENSLRNTVTMFNVLDKEREYRESVGKTCPWAGKAKPIVSVGLTTALDGTKLDATYFHGNDGLGNSHTIAPHFTPPQEHLDLFDAAKERVADIAHRVGFIASQRPSYEEILDVLRQEEPGTVTICAIGPLQNIAKAAEVDPGTFSRVKEISVMGASINHPGNVSPLAEFNVYSDPLASAIVYALSATDSSATMPDIAKKTLSNFPRPIPITLFPLDITEIHVLDEADFNQKVDPLLSEKSPLAEWCKAWVNSTFRNMERLKEGKPQMQLHDPLAAWYLICAARGELNGWKIDQHVDVRVETKGEWSRGHTIVDKRGRLKLDDAPKGDENRWLVKGEGNRTHVAYNSPYTGAAFGKTLLDIIFN